MTNVDIRVQGFLDNWRKGMIEVSGQSFDEITLEQRIENLLFVIWIQDQRHDYWMKFIKEVRTALEILGEEIKEDEGLLHRQ